VHASTSVQRLRTSFLPSQLGVLSKVLTRSSTTVSA
jgi:hypothetical protein